MAFYFYTIIRTLSELNLQYIETPYHYLQSKIYHKMHLFFLGIAVALYLNF